MYWFVCTARTHAPIQHNTTNLSHLQIAQAFERSECHFLQVVVGHVEPQKTFQAVQRRVVDACNSVAFQLQPGELSVAAERVGLQLIYPVARQIQRL